MPNKGFRVIWLSLHAERGRGLRLLLPISLNVFRELMDCVLDVMALICIFAPEEPGSGSRISVRTTEELVRMLMELFGTINGDGPYDLVDVEADNVKVSIKIR